MNCATCTNSATRDTSSPKADASRKAMVRAGMVACTLKNGGATYLHATRERQCAQFAPMDADKAAARLKFFGVAA